MEGREDADDDIKGNEPAKASLPPSLLAPSNFVMCALLNFTAAAAAAAAAAVD